MTDKGKVHALHVLVVGTEAWAMDRAVRALQQAGHQVVHCPLTEHADATCAVFDGERCDLDQHLDVVLSVRARPLDRVVRPEYGPACALRRGVPLVLAGRGTSSPFARFATSSVDLDGDVVTACVDAARSPADQPSPSSVDELDLLVRRRPRAFDVPVRMGVAHSGPARGHPVTP